jgi:hypothetical protein
MTFPDHFSVHADRYEAFRPTYPDALFAYLASLVPAHDLAWDCATAKAHVALEMTDLEWRSRRTHTSRSDRESIITSQKYGGRRMNPLKTDSSSLRNSSRSW